MTHDLKAIGICGIGVKGCYIEAPQKWNPKINLNELVGQKVRIKRADFETYKVVKVEAPKDKEKRGQIIPPLFKLFVEVKNEQKKRR